MKAAYSILKFLKIRDFISLQNAVLVNDVFEEKIPSPFSYDLFQKTEPSTFVCVAMSQMNQSAFVPIVNTEIHGINSIKYRSVEIYMEQTAKSISYEMIFLILHERKQKSK